MYRTIFRESNLKFLVPGNTQMFQDINFFTTPGEFEQKKIKKIVTFMAIKTMLDICIKCFRLCVYNLMFLFVFGIKNENYLLTRWQENFNYNLVPTHVYVCKVYV